MERSGDFEWDSILNTALKSVAEFEQHGTGILAKTQRIEYTPVGLLSTFKRHYISDEPAMNFDYISLQHSCDKVMWDIYGFHLPSTLLI